MAKGRLSGAARCAAQGIILMNFFSIPVLHAQLMNEGSSHPPLVSARAAAMGDAYSAEVSDIAMMAWNPGALPLLDEPSVMLDHYMEPETKIMNEVLASPLWMGSEE